MMMWEGEVPSEYARDGYSILSDQIRRLSSRIEALEQKINNKLTSIEEYDDGRETTRNVENTKNSDLYQERKQRAKNNRERNDFVLRSTCGSRTNSRPRIIDSGLF